MAWSVFCNCPSLFLWHLGYFKAVQRTAVSGRNAGVTGCAQLTSFSNSEEQSMGLHEKVPFLLEDRLKELGAKYKKVGLLAMPSPTCAL